MKRRYWCRARRNAHSTKVRPRTFCQGASIGSPFGSCATSAYHGGHILLASTKGRNERNAFDRGAGKAAGRGRIARRHHAAGGADAGGDSCRSGGDRPQKAGFARMAGRLFPGDRRSAGGHRYCAGHSRYGVGYPGAADAAQRERGGAADRGRRGGRRGNVCRRLRGGLRRDDRL